MLGPKADDKKTFQKISCFKNGYLGILPSHSVIVFGIAFCFMFMRRNAVVVIEVSIKLCSSLVVGVTVLTFVVFDLCPEFVVQVHISLHLHCIQIISIDIKI